MPTDYYIYREGGGGREKERGREILTPSISLLVQCGGLGAIPRVNYVDICREREIQIQIQIYIV